MADPKFIEGVPIGRIFLALNNPRHETYDTEGKVIAYLCQKESIYPLAKDIVKWRLNPLERFALVPGTKKRDSTAPTYVSAEGNRRICALKLLNDPELAPANLRNSFERLAEQWDSPITKVSAAVFDDPEDPAIDHWLERIHNGFQGGTGRKDWSADQKQRFYGGSKNRAALALLDYAQTEGTVTKGRPRRKTHDGTAFLGQRDFPGSARFRPKRSG
jgi:hypothetical protein